MRSARGDIETFNFGPDIETLRANCKAETGLDAPSPPVFR
jgi:N-methylhydantoinase B